MKPEIIQIESMLPSVEAKLAENYTVHHLPGRADIDALPQAARGQVRAIVTGGGTGAAPALIEALPSLEIITINGVGTDAVDLDLCRSRGIRVTNTPEVLTDDVADLAFGLILATLRQLCLGDRFVRAGQWGKEKFPLGVKVTGKRLGILGLGRIGVRSPSGLRASTWRSPTTTSASSTRCLTGSNRHSWRWRGIAISWSWPPLAAPARDIWSTKPFWTPWARMGS